MHLETAGGVCGDTDRRVFSTFSTWTQPGLSNRQRLNAPLRVDCLPQKRTHRTIRVRQRLKGQLKANFNLLPLHSKILIHYRCESISELKRTSTSIYLFIYYLFIRVNYKKIIQNSVMTPEIPKQRTRVFSLTLLQKMNEPPRRPEFVDFGFFQSHHRILSSFKKTFKKK